MDKEKKNIIYMINKLNIIKIKNLFEIKPNKLYQDYKRCYLKLIFLIIFLFYLYFYFLLFNF